MANIPPSLSDAVELKKAGLQDSHVVARANAHPRLDEVRRTTIIEIIR
jgi:hypothetical protein